MAAIPVPPVPVVARVAGGRVALLVCMLCAPSPALGQEAPGPYRHTLMGLATGITVVSVAVPAALGESTCFGSGDYLQLCRIVFVGATALGGGLGALVGRLVRSEEPPGPGRSIAAGSAVGALGAFLVSLPLCGQEEEGNPDLLCGYDGMIEPATVLVAAATGGMLGYLLRGNPGGVEVSRFGPVPAPEGKTAWTLAFAIPK